MNERVIQEDFGGFNPRFPGVTIRLASAAALNLLQQSLTGKANHVPDDSLAEIALASVVDHEVRHYHDALVSPYSNAIFRLRVQAAFNGVQAIASLGLIDAAELLPLPLATWLTMDDTARAAQLDDWRSLMGQGSPRAVPLPTRTLDQLHVGREPGWYPLTAEDEVKAFGLTTEGASLAYLRIEQLVAGAQQWDDMPEMQPCNVYEVIALCVQLHSIWVMQGEAQVRAFIAYLSDSPLGYARLWRRVFVIASRTTPSIEGHEVGVRRQLAVTRQMMAICVWSIIGNYQTDGLAACPTVRLVRLLSYLIDDAQSDPRADFAWDIAETWDRWDRALGLGSKWRDALSDLRAQADRNLAGAKRMATEWYAGPKIPDLVAYIVEQHVQDQHLAIDLLLSDPESFVNPARYVRLPPGRLPLPMFRVEFEGVAIHVDDLRNTAYIASTVREYEGQQVATRMILRTDEPDFERRREYAEGFELLAMTCDLAFSGLSVPMDMHATLIAGLQRETRKRPLFIV